MWFFNGKKIDEMDIVVNTNNDLIQDLRKKLDEVFVRIAYIESRLEDLER
jgi:hypothetical protein